MRLVPRPRVCAEPGCPELTNYPYCIEHRRTRERARGTRQQRGYDADHMKLRAAWVPEVRAGRVRCRRCRRLIEPDALWDLGHPDADCPAPIGPEHTACNRATAGR